MKERTWLIELRKAKNLTQAEIAAEVSISRSHYADIERGYKNPSGPVAARLADLFKCDMMLFFAEFRGSQTKTA